MGRTSKRKTSSNLRKGAYASIKFLGLHGVGKHASTDCAVCKEKEVNILEHVGYKSVVEEIGNLLDPARRTDWDPHQLVLFGEVFSSSP